MKRVLKQKLMPWLSLVLSKVFRFDLGPFLLGRRLRYVKDLNGVNRLDFKVIVPIVNLESGNIGFSKVPHELISVQKICKGNEFKLKFGRGNFSLLPILWGNPDTRLPDFCQVEIYAKGGIHKVELLNPSKVHYISIHGDENNECTLSSRNSDLLIGKPIEMAGDSNSRKLVLHIFIDALAEDINKVINYDAMPNTTNFFKRMGGHKAKVFSQGEWTLSSMAGVFTGKYTNEHLIYHPRQNAKIKHSTLADHFASLGFYTFGCTNVPKLHYKNGFDKGFDRFIYAEGRDQSYIFDQIDEQIEFSNCNQYIFAGFFDIHEAHTLQPISSQALYNIDDARYKKITGNSKDTKVQFDAERARRYAHSLTHFDRKLKRLYENIELYEGDVTVVLHSDHGVNFISNTENLLSRERTLVPLYYVGKQANIDLNQAKEVREVFNILINEHTQPDREINFKDYAITESLYPNKDYEICVRKFNHVLFFRTRYQNLIDKIVDNLAYYSSFHDSADESISVIENKVFDELLDVALKHYRVTVQNFHEVGSI